MKKEIHIHLHINSLVDTIEVKTGTVKDIKEELLEALARLVNEDTMYAVLSKPTGTKPE